MYGGGYGAGDVVYAGCDSILRLPEDADFVFGFFELFEDLFFGVALVGRGKVSFVTGEEFGDVFA